MRGRNFTYPTVQNSGSTSARMSQFFELGAALGRIAGCKSRGAGDESACDLLDY